MRQLTIEQKKHIAEVYNNGLTAKQVEKKYRIPEWYLYRHILKEYGVPKTRSETIPFQTRAWAICHTYIQPEGAGKNVLHTEKVRFKEVFSDEKTAREIAFATYGRGNRNIKVVPVIIKEDKGE